MSFRSWFHEIKKCRPELKLSYSPNNEQSQIIKEFQWQEMAIKTLKLELESLTKQQNAIITSPSSMPRPFEHGQV